MKWFIIEPSISSLSYFIVGFEQWINFDHKLRFTIHPKVYQTVFWAPCVFLAFSKLLLFGWFWCEWGWFYSWGWGWMGVACRKKWVKKTRVDAAFSRRSGYRWMREGWELRGKSWRFISDCCIALRELHSNTNKELSSSIFQSLSVWLLGHWCQMSWSPLFQYMKASVPSTDPITSISAS